MTADLLRSDTTAVLPSGALKLFRLNGIYQEAPPQASLVVCLGREMRVERAYLATVCTTAASALSPLATRKAFPNQTIVPAEGEQPGDRVFPHYTDVSGLLHPQLRDATVVDGASRSQDSRAKAEVSGRACLARSALGGERYRPHICGAREVNAISRLMPARPVVCHEDLPDTSR